MTHPHTGHRPHLSPRLQDCLQFVAAGHTNQSAAEVLGVRPDTIRTHLKRLYQVLGANGRGHAVAIGYDHGLLQPGASRGTTA